MLHKDLRHLQVGKEGTSTMCTVKNLGLQFKNREAIDVPGRTGLKGRTISLLKYCHRKSSIHDEEFLVKLT